MADEVAIPIACTLEAVAARAQVDEWRATLAGAVARAERVSPDRLALRLHADLPELHALALLAQREKACCDFFRFSFEVEADAVTFVVGVPTDAVAILDDLARLADPS